MDPLTALSLASSIVQFIDFGSTLVKKGNEIYQSADGSLSKNLEIETAATSLLTLTNGLKDPPLDAAATTEELEVVRICIACREIAADLQAKLAELKVKGKPQRWKSFRAAIKSVWTEEAVDEVVSRLAWYRDQLQFGIMVSLAKKIDLQRSDFINRMDKLDVDTREMVQSILNDIRTVKLQLQTPTETTGHLFAAITNQHEETRNVIIDSVRQIIQNQHYENSALSQSVEPSTNEIMITNAVLENNLKFIEMRDRHEEVVEAFEKTFEWAYCDPALGKSWSSFSSWLQEEQGIYWVHGKPGAGKSTLMRFLLDNPKTLEYLRIWGGQVSVHIASFFFWNSGTVEQRSLSGLRSMLYEILRNKPHLVRHVLPELWDVEASIFRGTHAFNLHKWTFLQLRKAFQLLAQQKVEPIKLCLFIDGLDECEGNFTNISDFCHYLASFPNIKVCVSSRPLVVFEEAFRGLPALRLHDLTFEDIKAFVKGKLHSHRWMSDLARLEPDQAPKLITEIVETANGVFLWVKLAVDSLLEGLRNRDRISDLQKRLRLLPQDLNDFYRMMLQKIPPANLEHASQLFQIVRENQFDGNSLTVKRLYFADENYSPAIVTTHKELSLTELEMMNETVEVRLKSNCVGFLEITIKALPTEDGLDALSKAEQKTKRNITYIHRSANEFLKTPMIWNQLLTYTSGSGFNPSVALLRSIVMELRTLHDEAQFAKKSSEWNRMYGMNLSFEAFQYAFRAGRDTGDAQINLLDELDNVMSYWWRLWAFQWLHRHGQKKIRDPPHWMHGYCYSGRIGHAMFQCKYCTMQSPCSECFVFQAITEELYEYSLHKIAQDPRVLTAAGVPLLFAPIIKCDKVRDPQGTLEFISKLLLYDLDPNLTFCDNLEQLESVWTWSFKKVTPVETKSRSNYSAKEWLHYWAKVLNLFSMYGGHPSTRIVMHGFKGSDGTLEVLKVHTPRTRLQFVAMEVIELVDQGTALEVAERVFQEKDGTNFPEAIELKNRLRAYQSEIDRASQMGKPKRKWQEKWKGMWKGK